MEQEVNPMKGRERSNMDMRWGGRRKRRDRLTVAQDEEGMHGGRSAQPPGQLKRWVGWAAPWEGGP